MQQNLCEKISAFSIPSQHMIMLRRIDKNQPLFVRNAQQSIENLNFDNIELATLATTSENKIDYSIKPEFKPINQIDSQVSPYIPVSSGTRGPRSILTFSGIFRINETRTNQRRNAAPSVMDPMQYSVYINGEYNSGKESGVAFHGTSTPNWKNLGKSPASHGCIRLHTNFSQWNQNYLFEKNGRGELVGRTELVDDVSLWSRRDLFPPSESVFNALPKGRKLKVLAIFFDGYQSQCL